MNYNVFIEEAKTLAYGTLYVLKTHINNLNDLVIDMSKDYEESHEISSKHILEYFYLCEEIDRCIRNTTFTSHDEMETIANNSALFVIKDMVKNGIKNKYALPGEYDDVEA